MIKRTQQTPAAEIRFVKNLEQLYLSDPMRLLAFAKTLMRFGDNDQNMILKVVLKWYIKGEFFQRKAVKLRKPSGQNLTDEFTKLINAYELMPTRMIGKDVHDTMMLLLPDDLKISERDF
jgi:hypothetical protein